ncbi:hypothetical protein OPV22_011868 [Ensete ventricosum]|uniref:Formamidopyrimidine-DNA glycosylase catalytic domain-containing protein n=1 Tax=Ensete ventricosum TaxID=4639 RepID=A0AAV8REF4_ENSVE|nr:hypothetical protein OPV22_011868 [Ensete ventricosum]
MPELPEVEAARRAIEEHCTGKKIAACSVADDPKVIEGVSRSDLEAALRGKTILAALRKGKSLWLRLDSPPFPTFHFGMAGAVSIKGVAVTKYKRSAVSDTDEWPSKHSKVFVELDDGLAFSFTDKRRFARVRLLEDPESVPPISELGPDALLELMPVGDFVESLSKKKTAIKALLLDQSYISGIGNWIADEVLYQAKIHPLQIASSLSKECCKSLHRYIREVIEYAVEVDADSNHFPIEWLFHFRWGKRSGKVNGMKIEFITAAGRTSAYVPELQKLTGNQSEKVSRKKSTKVMPNKNVDAEESPSEKEETCGTSMKNETTEDNERREKKTSETENDRISSKGMAKKHVAVAESSLRKRSKSSRANL